MNRTVKILHIRERGVGLDVDILFLVSKEVHKKDKEDTRQNEAKVINVCNSFDIAIEKSVLKSRRVIVIVAKIVVDIFNEVWEGKGRRLYKSCAILRDKTFNIIRKET